MSGKSNVLKFLKNKNNIIDIDGIIYDVVQCDKNKFTIRDFKLQEGHDDSLPYTAILCNNGKPLCSCFNDGNGGTTTITPLDAMSKAIMTSISLKFKESFSFKTKDCKDDVEIPVTLDFIADILAYGENKRNSLSIKLK